MKTMLLITIFISTFFFTKGFGQVASTAAAGAFAIGERDITFTNSSLAAPNVSAKAFYPATSSGPNQPVANGQFPVIAFGHGFNLDFLDYRIICGHLASWGYIVITPDVQNGFNVSHLEFARELAACIDHIRSEGSNASSPFFQKTDTMTGVLGHSMGGGASALVPSVYPSIDAVSGFAAAETTPSAISELANYAGPFQAISGSSDNTAPEASNQVPMYNAATGFKQHVSITGGAHCKFTDGSTVCDFVSSAGTVTRDTQIHLAKKYATAFLNHFLKADMDALPFLCGDSLQADINLSKISSSTNIACQTGITDPTQTQALSAWPLPVESTLQFTGCGWVSLTDLQGKTMKKVFVEAGETGKMSLEDLPEGIYILHTTLESLVVPRM